MNHPETRPFPPWPYLNEEHTQPPCPISSTYLRNPLPYSRGKALRSPQARRVSAANGRDAKSGKDVDQASVLCAALAELHPGAIEEAVEALPRKMAKHFRKAARRLPRSALNTSLRKPGQSLAATKPRDLGELPNA